MNISPNDRFSKYRHFLKHKSRMPNFPNGRFPDKNFFERSMSRKKFHKKTRSKIDRPKNGILSMIMIDKYENDDRYRWRINTSKAYFNLHSQLNFHNLWVAHMKTSIFLKIQNSAKCDFRKIKQKANIRIDLTKFDPNYTQIIHNE